MALFVGSAKLKAYLKRIFMGRLVPLPSDITEGIADYDPPIEIPSDRECKGFKILYAMGKK
ncbi:MAG: hypothetical protein A2026_17415 [Deltaproteobacteria bacterium RBG_19FT_COMBO_46_12]|nr:MAG: hypothetical protein A2026_17415 [Deltaproteobacteria bacterium RBG_19FT_COMBO_46_12]